MHGRSGDVGAASSVETLRIAREVDAKVALTETANTHQKALQLVRRGSPNATAHAAKNFEKDPHVIATMR